jgi:sulfoxide reductase catalytic subunit YedY
MNRRRFVRVGLAGLAGALASACSLAAPAPSPTPRPAAGSTPLTVASPAPTPRGYVAPGTLMHNENAPGFFIRFIEPVPAPDPARWELKIKGLVDIATTMTLDHIRKNLAFIEQNTRMKCVEGWSSRAVWGGFTYAALAALVKPQPSVTHVRFECDDNYYEILPISELTKARALFVTHMDGQPLGAKYGAPLRMIIPWLYGYKGAKTINTLEFVAKGGQGYWSDVGPYSATGYIQAGSDIPLDLDGKPRRVSGGEVTDY